MSFLHPEFLYYMLPPLFIFFMLLLTQKETQAHFFSEEVMDKLRVSANTLSLKARNALFFLMAVSMVIALAQPVIKEGVIKVKAKSADIMIALDISDSMLAEDVYPNRLKLAKQKALEFLKIQPNERVGVIAFAKNSYLVSPLSFDHSAVAFLLKQLNTDSITEKGTDFLSMLDVVNNSVKKDSKKYLLVFSDGGDSDDFSKEIEYAKSKDIVVFVLGIGSKKGAPIKRKDGTFIKYHGDIIVSKLNENISDLATKSGGVYIQNVNSYDDIKAMLKEINRVSDKKELKSEDVQRYIPLFYYPVGFAMLILIIALSSMSKRETVNIPNAFILFALLFNAPYAKAGLLDFIELKEAKEAYENKNYKKASKLYEKNANSNNNGQSYYNAGNAYYKQKKYDKAIKSYEKATFNDTKQTAKNFANMGNAYVKQSKEDSLQKAKKFYEESLKLHEDKQVRENLEEVEKRLKQQQKPQENKQKSNDKKDSDNKQNQDKNKDNKETPQDENKKSDENKNSKDKSDKSKQDDKSDKNSKQNQDKKEQNKDTDKEDKKNSQSSDTNETKQQKNKDDLKELDEDKKEKKYSKSSAQTDLQQVKMSDAEEKKWLKELNQNQNSYMYMLGNQKPKEDNSDEKPW